MNKPKPTQFTIVYKDVDIDFIESYLYRYDDLRYLPYSFTDDDQVTIYLPKDIDIKTVEELEKTIHKEPFIVYIFVLHEGYEINFKLC